MLFSCHIFCTWSHWVIRSQCLELEFYWIMHYSPCYLMLPRLCFVVLSAQKCHFSFIHLLKKYVSPSYHRVGAMLCVGNSLLGKSRFCPFHGILRAIKNHWPLLGRALVMIRWLDGEEPVGCRMGNRVKETSVNVGISAFARGRKTGTGLTLCST